MKEKTHYDRYCEKSKYRFFINQLLETGLSFIDNQFSYTREGKTFKSMYMSPDDDGNVRFYVPDIITGDLEQYTYGQPPNQKIRDWYLTRWIKPKETKTGPAKYTPVRNSGTRCLYTKPIIEAFHKRKQIKTLFVIEGFKKALSAAVNGGLPMVGINGLTGFKEPGEENQKLRKEIREILTVCKVQRVVIIYDSDLLDLSGKKNKAETSRPNQFFRAALMAKILFEQFADVYLAHPNPNPEKKYGFDDLLLEHRNISRENIPVKLVGEGTPPKTKLVDGQKKLFVDLLKAVNEHKKSTYFTAYKLSSLADYRIKQIFHLNNVQAFYEFYRKDLMKRPNKRFRFYTHTYQINADETLQEIEADNTRHINIETRLGKLIRLTDKGPKELANFTMRVLFQIDSEDDPKRIVEITNYDSVSRIVEVSSKTFISLADFQALMISYGDFIWKGTKDDLLDIMTILFKHEKPATLINQLGWQPLDGFYAFSNGIVNGQGFKPVDEYGMVSHNENNFYFPAWSKFNARDYDTYRDMKKFSHFKAKKPATFTRWKKQFVEVYKKNGEIAVSYFIAALFSDIVFHHKSGIGFPLLWSAGKPKTGKSTICTSILSMFGQPSEAIGLAGKSTIKYFINRFAQVRNGLIHLDEYSNNKVNKDIKEILKNIYDRIGYGRKAFSNDFRTINTPILSAALVSGEEIPTDNHALFTRATLLLFNQDKFSVAERSNFLKLRDMEEDGLTHITIELLSYRQLIEDHFDDTFNEVFNDFYQKFKTRKIDDRILKNASWLVTPVKILMDLNKIDYAVSYNELLAVFYDNIERQDNYMEANTDIAKFWDIIEMLFVKKELSETKGDFQFIDDTIAIRMNRVHMPYVIEARKLGYEKILDKSTLQNYLSNEPYFVENLDSKGKKKLVRFNNSAPTTAMYFMYKDIKIDLKGDNHEYIENTFKPPESKLSEKEKKELPF